MSGTYKYYLALNLFNLSSWVLSPGYISYIMFHMNNDSVGEKISNDNSFVIDESDYWKVATHDLTPKQRQVYEYLYKNKIYHYENAITCSQLASCIGAKQPNVYIVLTALTQKGLILVRNNLFWVKKIPIVSKTKMLQVEPKLKNYLYRSDAEFKKFQKEQEYIEDDLYQLFDFISPQNVDKFILIYTAKMEKNQKRVKHLKALKEKYENVK